MVPQYHGPLLIRGVCSRRLCVACHLKNPCKAFCMGFFRIGKTKNNPMHCLSVRQKPGSSLAFAWWGYKTQTARCMRFAKHFRATRPVQQAVVFFCVGWGIRPNSHTFGYTCNAPAHHSSKGCWRNPSHSTGAARAAATSACAVLGQRLCQALNCRSKSASREGSFA